MIQNIHTVVQLSSREEPELKVVCEPGVSCPGVNYFGLKKCGVPGGKSGIRDGNQFFSDGVKTD